MSKIKQDREDLWQSVPLQVALRDTISVALTGYKYLELKEHAVDDMLDVVEEYKEIDKLVNLLANMFAYYRGES